ncbi:MAG: hypothetical protein JWP22_1546 [Ramlibacter sp.]|jgi:hypothetical protein|nr:hypothetical protein [Ramlibacter sp.]MDB5912871.1 hypothetical protein [Ramlibacter sp.]
MSIRSSLATAIATAAMAVAASAQAAPVTIEQTVFLTNPAAGAVYNIATDGSLTAPTTSYYQLIVDASWNQLTKFTTFSAEPVGTPATYTLYTDTNPALGETGPFVSDTGPQLVTWTQSDVPLNNNVPFFTYLLTAGQYVLAIATQAGQLSISTNISAVPLPGAIWLFGTGLLAFLGISSRRKM